MSRSIRYNRVVSYTHLHGKIFLRRQRCQNGQCRDQRNSIWKQTTFLWDSKYQCCHWMRKVQCLRLKKVKIFIKHQNHDKTEIKIVKYVSYVLFLFCLNLILQGLFTSVRILNAKIYISSNGFFYCL